ncbi:unnamed protein product, partial [marine sediment metagenome]
MNRRKMLGAIAASVVAPKTLLSETTKVKVGNLCGFTDEDKAYFLKKHNATLQELLFDEGDTPKDANPKFIERFRSPGVINENGLLFLVSTFSFDKNGDVLSLRCEMKKCMPLKWAILREAGTACARARYHYKEKSKLLHVYVTRSVFHPKMV